jgi:hypothetical protein
LWRHEALAGKKQLREKLLRYNKNDVEAWPLTPDWLCSGSLPSLPD